MSAVLGSRSDLGPYLVRRLGFQQPIIELIYIAFVGSAIGGLAAGGGRASEPMQNLAQIVLIFGLYVPRLIARRRSIRLLLDTHPPFQFFFLTQALLIPVRFVIGVLNGSPRNYLFSDLLLAVTAILIYLVSRNEYRRLLPINDSDALGTLVPVVLILLFLGFLPVEIASPGGTVAIMGAIIVLLLAASRGPAWQAFIGLAIFAMYLVAVPRGFLIAIGLTAILIAFSNIFWRTILGVILLVTAIGSYAILNYKDLPFLPQRVLATGAIVEAAEGIDWTKLSFQDLLSAAQVSVAIHQRIYEAEKVVKTLDEGGPLAWALGKGFGACLNMSDAPDPAVRNANLKAGIANAGLVHAVHLMVFEQLFRYGLLGLSIFLWLGWRMIKVYRIVRKVIVKHRRITFDFLVSLTLIGSYVSFQFGAHWEVSFVGFALLGYLDARFDYVRNLKARSQASAALSTDLSPQPA